MLGHAIMHKQAGFSLVEMMIVVVLLAIIAAIAVPSFTQMIQNSRIRTAAESIQNGLQIARAEAVKRNARVKFQLNNGDSGWVICEVANAADSCPGEEQIQTRAVSEGSTADVTTSVVPTGRLTAVFTGMGLLDPAANSFTQVDVDMSAAVMSPADSRELRIIVGAGGSIRMCDPNLAETDPRAC
jgi:type IV fimbrial biogenesis protein FimT